MLTQLACGMVLAFAASAAWPGVEGRLEPGRETVVTVPSADHARTVALVVVLKRPSALAAGAPVGVKVEVGGSTLRKTLHLGDPDVTWLVRQPAGAGARVTLTPDKSHPAPLPFAVRATEVVEEPDGGVAFEAEPNDRPEEANAFTFGRTVYGLADDRPYLPLGAAPTSVEADVGKDWFTFTYDGDAPKLAFFALDFVDRDVPTDVRVYRLRDGKAVEFTDG